MGNHTHHVPRKPCAVGAEWREGSLHCGQSFSPCFCEMNWFAHRILFYKRSSWDSSHAKVKTGKAKREGGGVEEECQVAEWRQLGASIWGNIASNPHLRLGVPLTPAPHRRPLSSAGICHAVFFINPAPVCLL